MTHCFSTVIRFPSKAKRGGNLIPPMTSRESLLDHWRPHSISIHILNDDSLLSVFYYCRPVLSDEDEANDGHILEGEEWDCERWWYKPAQVCRRWRHLMLGFASYLGLSLVCSHGTPVPDMLAHSPPLPLIIDHVDKDRHVNSTDEEAIILALRHRDRVRRIRLLMPVPNLQKLIPALDGEFPMLDYLYMAPLTKHNTGLILPKTLDAPHLRHLILKIFALPIRSLLLTTGVGLNTLFLDNIHPYPYFSPHDLLRWLSPLPQLKTLLITFHSPVPSRKVERELLHRPIMTHVTLSHLRWFGFKGVSAYLEALLPRITTPVLEKLQISLFNQPTFSFPHLLQFINATETLRFRSARLMFHEEAVSVRVYPSEGATTYALHMQVGCGHLDWQVASAAQIFNALGTVFSTVDYLTLEYWRHIIWSSWQNEADRIQWRDLLRSFSHVKTLRVPYHLVGDLSRSLQADEDEGESPTELLPELKELSYFTSGGAGDGFTPFILARQNAGRPVSLARH